MSAFERPDDYGEHFKQRYGPTIAARANAEKEGRAEEFDQTLSEFCAEWNHGSDDEARFEHGVPADRRAEAGLRAMGRESYDAVIVGARSPARRGARLRNGWRAAVDREAVPTARPDPPTPCSTHEPVPEHPGACHTWS